MAFGCDYAIFATTAGDIATTPAQRQQIERTQRHWSRHARGLRRPLIRRVDEALAAARSAT